MKQIYREDMLIINVFAIECTVDPNIVKMNV